MSPFEVKFILYTERTNVATRLDSIMSQAERIKLKALELGYCKAGITSADEFTDFVTELSSRGPEYDWWKNGARKPLESADPAFWLEGAKSVIVVAYDAFQHSFPENLVGVVGRIYQARCYVSPSTNTNGARRELFKDYLEEQGYKTVSSFWIPARAAAQRSGVASMGRNNFAYVEGVGSFIILEMFVVDAGLEIDEPAEPLKCADSCNKCIKACPTGALYAPYKLDPTKCIGFLNWMNQEKFGADPYIDPSLRSAIGTRIHGCDACQEVCPHNQKRLKANLLPDNFLFEIAKGFTLEKTLQLDDEYFETHIEPIMYNYIGEKTYFQRNAAIALANKGDVSAVPDLVRQLSNEESFVRGHVAWALGELQAPEAKIALQQALSDETDERAQTEIKAALSKYE